MTTTDQGTRMYLVCGDSEWWRCVPRYIPLTPMLLPEDVVIHDSVYTEDLELGSIARFFPLIVASRWPQIGHLWGNRQSPSVWMFRMCWRHIQCLENIGGMTVLSPHILNWWLNEISCSVPCLTIKDELYSLALPPPTAASRQRQWIYSCLPCCWHLENGLAGCRQSSACRDSKLQRCVLHFFNIKTFGGVV